MAELQFESGHPLHHVRGHGTGPTPSRARSRIRTVLGDPAGVPPSLFTDGHVVCQVGKDISPTWGRMNIRQGDGLTAFAQTIEVAIRAVTAVSDQTPTITSVTRKREAPGKNDSHADSRLGQMNLHGYWRVWEGIFTAYEGKASNSPNLFYHGAVHALRASQPPSR